MEFFVALLNILYYIKIDTYKLLGFYLFKKSHFYADDRTCLASILGYPALSTPENIHKDLLN